MRTKYCLVVLLMSGCLAFGQNESVTPAKDVGADNDLPLVVPPPATLDAFASTFEGEKEHNYLSGGVTVTAAYISNVTGGTPSVADGNYTIWPTIAFDKTTDQMHLTLNYAPGFSFYQETSSLNQTNQSFGAKFQYQFTPRLTAKITEGFQKTSNLFDQPNPSSTTPVFGSVAPTGIGVIVPAADFMSNLTTAQLTYQTGENSMIGGGGTYSTFIYPSPDQVTGLYNSRSAAGSFFYSTRIHQKYYVGATYRYENFLSFQTNLPSTQTNTQAVLAFLTTYLKPTLSLSIFGGPQHYTSSQVLEGTSSSWEPVLGASLSWRSERNTVAVSYSRAVSGGGGLNGIFRTSQAGALWNWRATRNWTTGVSGGYTDYNSLTPDFLYSNPGGHTLAGTVSLQRPVKEHMTLQFGYSFANQHYADLAPLAANPNINRAFVSFSFNFTRPLQR